jgi:hypothetical protein
MWSLTMLTARTKAWEMVAPSKRNAERIKLRGKDEGA